MKIAIATEGSMVAQHFGHCPEYTIVDVENNRVQSRVVIPNPGHRPGFLPEYLAGQGVSCVIAGGMGPRAQELFEQRNIETVIGVTGTVEDAINDYLAGRLKSGPSTCHHPGEGHSCGGHGCH